MTSLDSKKTAFDKTSRLHFRMSMITNHKEAICHLTADSKLLSICLHQREGSGGKWREEKFDCLI